MAQSTLGREKRKLVVLVDVIVPPSIMSPVEPASSGSFEFRFRWKTFAQPFAIIGGFVPVDVGYGKFFFAFWDLAFRPVPWRPNALCFDESCVVCVGCFMLVDIESIDVDVIRRPVVHL